MTLPQNPPAAAPAESTGSHAWAYLAGFLTVAGLAHLVVPSFFRPLIPEQLGEPDPWVYGSGAAEIAVGVALIPTRTRRVAAFTAAALFVVVFPGNLQMAWDARDAGGTERVLTLLRLPLQIPLIWWALHVAARAKTPPTSH